MSLRLEMLQVARLAPKLLGDSTDRVEQFVRSRLNPDGGFQDRAGQSDLYYTVFGLEVLSALRADLPSRLVHGYLETFSDGDTLDFPHLCCLARCWANLPRGSLAPARREHLMQRLERWRTADGGYNGQEAAEHGTAYGAFLALGAIQDLGGEIPHSAQLLRSLEALRCEDGSFANQPGAASGNTPATAAAIGVSRQLGGTMPASVGSWILERCHVDGGFFAMAGAPMPDLLSTAVALHALSSLHVSIEPLREPCLDFLDSLWSSQGGFFGHWADDVLDVEYLFYALLALGHLSL